jgi:hypothetical protein
MEWYWIFLIVLGSMWLLSMILFRAKKRYFWFYISSALPLMLAGALILVLLVIALVPIIYLMLLVYSFFIPNYKIWKFGKKIEIN